MPHLTIRNLDPAVKAALEARARADFISRSEAARRALARGFGLRIPRRDLGGLDEELLDSALHDALGRIDWTAPAFTDVELDAMTA
ncbi:hypothetical protein [uncultured Jannaschia sp.]|uniref:FitA-like ribbon-helix-helix domain-containing protein n=1 Tax=uncultured Jannaschia sp. TaxID=293347 RepID=UPI00262C5086|nr:hypothetical protein [uncultured Jannaschia sp.]